jgi:cytochrome c oxidase assembly protein subunit 15
LFLFILIPATGAWAALSNTLFPSADLLQGLADDLSSSGPWILKLRIIHPLMASAFCIYWAYFFWNQSESSENKETKKSSLFLAGFFVVES